MMGQGSLNARYRKQVLFERDDNNFNFYRALSGRPYAVYVFGVNEHVRIRNRRR